MVGTFEIQMEDKVVGRANVEKQGLYYYISCRCILPGKEMFRMIVSCGENREDLGVCVPMDGQFGVEKKIPCKRLGEGTPEFRIRTKEEKQQPGTKFIPVYPEEPFAYIRQLENAFLAHQNGQIGILIQEKDG